MARRTFNVYKPFREIILEDSFKEFQSELLDNCGTSLFTLFKENIDKKHAWVYEMDDEILGVIAFFDNNTEFYIDVVSNNFVISAEILKETKPGSSLYQTVEDIAILNGVSKITLDSIPERRVYWQNQFKFELTGTSFEGKFCQLYPMEKKLSGNFSI